MELERKGLVDVYLLLGSNIGDREEHIMHAEQGLETLGALIGKSQIYRTEPWQMEGKEWFFNRVVHLQTDLPAEALMQAILKIEKSLGRERAAVTGDGYQSRTIDIDILYYGDEVIESDALTIPHPRIQERRFALAPMVEVAPSLVHPILKQNQFELLKNCPDQSFLELV